MATKRKVDNRIVIRHKDGTVEVVSPAHFGHKPKKVRRRPSAKIRHWGV